MINWINSWKATNKKSKYELNLRLGTVTVLEVKACLFCEKGCTNKKFRLMVFNFGFEI